MLCQGDHWRVITIASMRTPDDARAFSRLNEAWIRSLFTLEARDRESLADPFRHYVEPGGDVLLARDHGDDDCDGGSGGDGRIVGCVALGRAGDGVFELSKMAVAETERGRGTGRLLLDAAIDRARTLGASSIFLGSNRRLVAAVRLYESVGFRHVPRERVGRLPYTRANVFMELSLDQGDGSSVPA